MHVFVEAQLLVEMTRGYQAHWAVSTALWVWLMVRTSASARSRVWRETLIILSTGYEDNCSPTPRLASTSYREMGLMVL